jgi:hypothetical protein
MDWQDQDTGQDDWKSHESRESQEWHSIAMDYAGWRIASGASEDEFLSETDEYTSSSPSKSPLNASSPAWPPAARGSGAPPAAPKQQESPWKRLFGTLFGRKEG